MLGDVLVKTKTELKASENVQCYVKALEKSFASFHYKRDFLFQCLDHQEWFKCKFIVVIDWSANFSDCNSIENLWSILSRHVFEQKKTIWKEKQINLLHKMLLERNSTWNLVKSCALCKTGTHKFRIKREIYKFW